MCVCVSQNRLGALKREEESLRDEFEKLAQEKAKYVRAIKRHRDEVSYGHACACTATYRHKAMQERVRAIKRHRDEVRTPLVCTCACFDGQMHLCQ